MATQLQLRKGTSAQTAVFTGATAEVTVDTTLNTLTVHDGVTAGGHYIARQVDLDAAYTKANTSGTTAQAGFDKANSATTLAQAAFNKANTDNTLAGVAYDQANTATTIAQSSYDSGNTTLTYAQSAYGKANSANVLAQAAFNAGNTTNAYAVAGYGQANTATTVAQAGYNQANTAYTAASDAYNFATSVSVTANAAFAKANTDAGLAQAAFDSGNTTYTYATSAYNTANTNGSAITVLQAVNTTQNTNITNADTKAQAAYDSGNTTLTYAQSGYAKANAANVIAQAAYDKANLSITIGNTVTTLGGSYSSVDNLTEVGFNTAAGFSVGQGQIAWNATDRTFDMGLYGGSVLQVGQEQHMLIKANNNITNGQTVMFVGANGDNILGDVCNTAVPGFSTSYFIGVATQTIAKNDFGYVTLYGKVHGLNTNSYTTGDILWVDNNTPGALTTTHPTVGTPHIQVAAVIKTSAGDGHIMVRPTIWPALDDLSNFSDAATKGQVLEYNGSVWAPTSNVLITQLVDNTQNTSIAYAFAHANSAYSSSNTKFSSSGGTITGDTIISANLSITGNLHVTGNVTTTDINNVSLANSIIYLAHDNAANTVDLGLVGSFTQGYYQHTGVVRDNADGVWKFFSNVITEPTSTVDFTGAVYDTIKVGGIQSPTATINGVELGAYSSAAFSKANNSGVVAQAAFDHSNTTYTYAQSAYGLANTNATLITGIQAVNSSQNTSISDANALAQAAYTSGNTNLIYAQAGFAKANSGTVLAQAAFDSGNTTYTYAQSAYGSGNTTLTYAQSAYAKANTSGTVAQAAFDHSNTTFTYATAGYGQANTGTTLAQAAFDSANTKLALTGGVLSGALTASSLTANTTVTVNTSSVITSTAYTTSSVSQVTVDTFATTTYRATKYLAQMTSGSSYHMIELNLIHDGTTVWLAQYGEVFTGSSLGTFDANISTGNVQLLFTPTNSSTTVKLMRTNIVV